MTPHLNNRGRLLPRVTFHALRHSSAPLLLAQRVHPRFIMELFGHSPISLTMNTYRHVWDNRKPSFGWWCAWGDSNTRPSGS
jgi:integrase